MPGRQIRQPMAVASITANWKPIFSKAILYFLVTYETKSYLIGAGIRAYLDQAGLPTLAL